MNMETFYPGTPINHIGGIISSMDRCVDKLEAGHCILYHDDRI
ncbi:hypothetical protein ACEQPO_04645 [Bacillus sp. SL00103]